MGFSSRFFYAKKEVFQPTSIWAHKYSIYEQNTDMRKLENILDLEEYVSMMNEGKKKDLHSSYPWWSDCKCQVTVWIYQDRTTCQGTLHEKAKNYASNYFAIHPEIQSGDKESLAKQIADEIAEELKKAQFDQRPPASVVAQRERFKIPEDPEKRFIKLR